jgi:hypothetical protein
MDIIRYGRQCISENFHLVDELKDLRYGMKRTKNGTPARFPIRQQIKSNSFRRFCSSNARIGRKAVIANQTAISTTGPPIVAVAPPIIPLIAANLRRLQSVRYIQRWPDVCCVVLPLQDLHCQAGGCMIRDVTMHEPRAWVVGFEGYYDVSIAGKQNDVASGRIVILRVISVGPCRVFDLLEDGKVVAVQMYLSKK